MQLTHKTEFKINLFSGIIAHFMNSAAVTLVELYEAHFVLNISSWNQYILIALLGIFIIYEFIYFGTSLTYIENDV